MARKKAEKAIVVWFEKENEKVVDVPLSRVPEWKKPGYEMEITVRSLAVRLEDVLVAYDKLKEKIKGVRKKDVAES